MPALQIEAQLTEVNADAIPDINDSEVLRIEGVLRKLQEKYSRQHVLLNDFPKEAESKFFDIGFRVRVDMYTTNVPGVVMPEITILERLEGEFDPDQQVWEVTQDILDLGTKGVIKSEGGTKTPGKGLILPPKS